MEKQKLIIVEGPQGTGKSTLTNYLRDNVIRLAMDDFEESYKIIDDTFGLKRKR